MNKSKKYTVLVQFDSVDLNIVANNKREAVRKAKARLKDISAYRYLDKRNIFVDESDDN